MTLVSIIILTKNAGKGFKRLLQKIFMQKFDGQFEVIIIDSGSTDNTLKTAEEFHARLYQIDPAEFNHGKTRNLGARLSRGEFLVYVTQDALPLRNDWLHTIMASFKDDKVAAVYGKQVPWRNARPPEKFFYHYYFPAHSTVLEYNGKKCFFGSEGNIFISNVNSAIRKSVWVKFKFSENIPMAEDKDFAKNVLFAGYKIVYDPNPCVFHSHNFGVLSVFKRFFDFGVALAQGIQELPKSEGTSLRRTFNYFLSEIKYLCQNNQTGWIIYAFIYDLSKLMGLFLGKHEKCLPLFLKTRFSEVYSYG